MMKKFVERFRRLLKEEKGLTLVELLAVIVILGIIAAIAVPSITGITGSTKKEAHKANARQMIEAAKQVVAINGFAADTEKFTPSILDTDNTQKAGDEIDDSDKKEKIMMITLKELKDGKYFPEGIKDPEDSSKRYDETKTYVIAYRDTVSDAPKYYVTIDGTTDLTNIAESDLDKLVIK